MLGTLQELDDAAGQSRGGSLILRSPAEELQGCECLPMNPQTISRRQKYASGVIREASLLTREASLAANKLPGSSGKLLG
jgi:hypothetical protein